jgi:hypothetical protein
VKNISAILFSFLVIINVFLCYKVLEQNKRIDLLKLENESEEELSTIIFFILENSNRSINPNQELSIEGDSITKTFSDLAIQPTLFLYYNDLSCVPCSDRELNKLDSLSKIIGSKNVFLLTQKTSFKNIFLLRRINSFSFKIVLIDKSIELPVSNYPTNYYFVLDSNLVIKMFFVPAKINQDINELYYKQIINYFKNIRLIT